MKISASFTFLVVSFFTLGSEALLLAGPPDPIPATSWGNRGAGARQEPLDYVDPFIGSTGDGGMMPFVTKPFGMTKWTPQARQNRVAVTSYDFRDKRIAGFIGTHQPAVWMGDFGYVSLMPEIGDIKTTFAARELPFSHNDEFTSPYDYQVGLDAGAPGKIQVEMTATDHCGFLKFQYPAHTTPSVVIEATRATIPGFVQVDQAKQEISGYNTDRMDSGLGPFKLPHFKGYFVIQFDKPVRAFGTYQGETLQAGSAKAEDKNVGAYATFASSDGQPVMVKVGTSFISIEQARANLQKEIPAWDFSGTREALKKAWQKKLDILSVEGGSDAQKEIFYTGLYHALLYPQLASEYGHYYSAYDDTVHAGVSYTSYSIWDIFRAEFSLLTIIAPERIGPMVNALLQDYKEGGWMPKWPNPSYTNIMIATHADSLVAEAMNKGFKGFDYHLAYQAVYHDAMDPPTDDLEHRWRDREPHTPYEARGGLTFYKKLGYVPADKTAESASSTVEDAYDDWCVGQVAKDLGQMDAYKYFTNRAQNYKNIYNPATGFMNARLSNGDWGKDTEGWTEGNKWHYTWSVLEDVPGLIQLMGGAKTFNERLDAHFSGNHNDHSNEPCHHYAYLYDYSGEPFKTQAEARDIMETCYSNKADGVDGNEDCGQMSAWYILSAMGFYSLKPASGEYLIGSPIFTKTTMNLPNGKRFIISAPDSTAENMYVQSAKLNGKPLNVPVFTYADIEKGGTLEFVMGPAPSSWGSDWKQEPLPKYPDVAVPPRP